MRSRRVDALLLATVLPLWAWLVGFTAIQLAAGRPTVWTPQILLGAARDADGHPTVRWVRPGWKGEQVIQPGDVLLRVGPEDLAGVARPGFVTRVLAEAAQGLPVPITLRRGDHVTTVGLDVRRPHPVGVAPVWALLTSLVFVVTAVLMLLRARASRAARPIFLGLTTGQFFFATFSGGRVGGRE